MSKFKVLKICRIFTTYFYFMDKSDTLLDNSDFIVALKALSNPIRLEILNYISTSKTCISGDISSHFTLSRTTIYQHLKELKKADLIHGEIAGVKTCYCLNQDRLVKVKEEFEKRIGNFIDASKTLDKCKI